MLTAPLYTVLAARFRDLSLERSVFIAVGEGRAAWDSMPPPYDRATTSLVAEVARRAVPAEQVVFLDGSGRPARRPTTRLRLSVVFEAGEGTGRLRECGLFEGEATAEAGSGTLLSYHTHPRIEKRAETSLERIVHLDFSPQAFVPGSRVTRWLGNTRSGEIHDLDARTPNCQIDEIRFDRRFYFTSAEEADALGYDPCAYCIGDEEAVGFSVSDNPVRPTVDEDG